jgi:hypothetical protein
MTDSNEYFFQTEGFDDEESNDVEEQVPSIEPSGYTEEANTPDETVVEKPAETAQPELPTGPKIYLR